MEETYQDLERVSQKTLQAFKEIMRFIGNCNHKRNQLKYAKGHKESGKIKRPSEIVEQINEKTGEISPFIFTGQATDLLYFNHAKNMPISEIAKIEDASLQTAVKSTFESAAKDGLLNVNSEKGIISLTDKGKKYISKPSFQKTAHKAQLNAFTKKLEQIKTSAAKTAGNALGVATKVGDAVIQTAVKAVKVLKKE